MLVVPSRPQSANVTRVLPTMVELDVQQPEEDGGMPITHYVVGFENEFLEFLFGLFASIDLLFCHIDCVVLSKCTRCHNTSCYMC